jgi:hypothetical protein
MLPFLTTLWANQIARKVILYGAVLLATLYGLRLWGNRQWAKGESQGRIAATADLEKAKAAEWKKREEDLAAGAAKLAVDVKTLGAQRAELAGARASLVDTFSRSMNQIRATREGNNATVFSIPDNQLDGALRDLSRELAAGAAH